MISRYRSPRYLHLRLKGLTKTSVFLTIFLALLIGTASAGPDGSVVAQKQYDGRYPVNETSAEWFPPRLEVNGTEISPMADDLTDITVSLCEGPQAWYLLKEYTPWKDVNMFGFYTDLGTGNNKAQIFEGPRNEGYIKTTMISDGTNIGLYLHNDVNNDSIYNDNDSYLFSERNLTMGSGANEHQWFKVYDVSAYKGTGAAYNFVTPTEDFLCGGDYDYLIYIDDNHTSANFDHNDLILGITCNADVTDSCGNIQPGVPPNYYGIDTSYFMGEPALPVPPPDSGGVYIWYNSTTQLWTIASHIYSKGHSLEQFHGNIVFLMDQPPQLGVNVFMDNFELWHDTSANRCLFQNDRWGWSQWNVNPGLYEIWWDVTTKEWLQGSGDLNDFMTIQLLGTAIDFNIWSSGHELGFGADQIYLGANMVPLSTIPGYYDYGGFDVIDQYQAAVGSNPSDDPNTSVFSRHCGLGESYNVLGEIDSSDTYVCDPNYGYNYAGPWTYQADGIQFSSAGIGDPCQSNSPPTCVVPLDETFTICADSTFEFIVKADDPDENGLGCVKIAGVGTLTDTVWSFTTSGAGVYSATFVCEDYCGATCTSTVNITVNYNSAPVCDLPANATYFVSGDSTFSFPVTATDADGNLTGCSMVSGDGSFDGTNWTFTSTNPGTYSATFECSDDCGATCSGTVEITVEYNNAPVCDLPANETYFVCDDTAFSFPISATDVDGNLDGCIMVSGDGSFDGSNWTFTTNGPGLYSATFECTDLSGASCGGTVEMTVDYNSAPVVTCPGDTSLFVCDLTEICIPGFDVSDPDGNLDTAWVEGCYLTGDTVCFNPVEGVQTIRFIAIDECGVADTCITNITIDLNANPVCDVPANETYFVCADSTFSFPISGTDEDGNLDSCRMLYGNGSFDGSHWTFTTSSAGVYSATFQCVDSCGAHCESTVEITVNYNQAPQITCPADIAVECDGSIDPSATGSATATDDNDPAPSVTYTDTETAGVCPDEKIITRTWTAIDNCGATSQCVQTITVEDTTPPVITCPADVAIECDQTPDPSLTGNATATDNCDGGPAISYGDSQVGNIITRTWTATDACGNSTSCEQIITIEDTTPPQISCPADISVECDASVDPSVTGSATATDNCDIDIDITYVDSEVAGSCPQEKVITRTWTATDDNGNSAQCDQIITVEDTTPPVITCPADVAIECDQTPDPSLTGNASATDNCDNGPAISYSDSQVGNTITRTWTATDACGNSTSCTQTITIEDTTPPQISCPADISVECDASVDPSVTGSATATDNCDIDIDITYVDSEVAGNCPQEKVITRTWTATDDNGNSAQCDQIITVEDTTAPVITCPADVDIECDQTPDPSLTGNGSATDNCDNGPAISYSDSQVGNTITRTWTATDACGNSTSCTQTITIEDTTTPQFTSCALDITISCDDDLGPSFTGSPVVTDNCSPDPSMTYTDTEVPGTCPEEKVITRVWTVTDDAGNSAQCSQTITVIDDTAPVITCPSDVAIECDQTPDPSLTGNASATDNCDNGPAISYSDSQVGNTITRTWTATDACGNSTSCTQTITIEDTTPPQISCPADISVECDASVDPSVTGSATATDNCDIDIDITYVDSEVAGNCPQEKVITRTWTAADDNGNSASCDQIITVEDTTAPAITCPSDVAIECDQTPDPSLTGNASATDNCDNAPAISYSDSQVGNTITRTWTATDACGNSTSCEQIITIEDTTPPQISCPADISVECDASVDPSVTGSATATDNCDIDIDITYVDSEVAGNCPQEKVITRTWTAADDNGNSASCDQIITVEDTTAPAITCPSDVAIECDQTPDPSLTGNASATDNCDNAPSIGYSDSQVGNTITRTWTATDACGNSASCEQTITIEDTTPPQFTSCALDITISCDDDLGPSFTGSPVVTDNCSPDPSMTYTDTEVPGTCPEEKVITRVWTVTDDAGNSAQCSQTITVIDDTAPVITCPADVAIECDQTPDPSLTGNASATDNCDNAPAISYSDSQVGNTITRTWTATDACGNSTSCTQTITIEDTTPPQISCPADISVECDASVDPSVTGSATATDNCDIDIDITYVDSEVAGNCPQEKVITRTWTATDDNGNSSQCDQIITVEDTTPPVITCPNDYNVECDGSIDPSLTGNATATDNCDTAPGIVYVDSQVGNIITRTWTATDACGNSAECTQTITLITNEPPIATCPGDTAIFVCSLDEICLDGFSCNDPDGNLSTCEVTNGALDNGTVCFTPVEGENEIVLIATDACGKADTCMTMITVTLNRAPLASVPSDQSMQVCNLDEICIDGFSCSDPDGNLSNCDVDGGILNGSQVCFTPNEGENMIKLIAADDCGVADTAVTIVTVNLNQAPIAHCAGDRTFKTTEFPVEVCVPGFYCEDPDGNLTGCNVTGGTISNDTVCFTADSEGYYAIEVEAIDDCGLSTTCYTEVFVKRITSCPLVKIEKTHGTLQGHYEDVSITIDNGTYEIGGFDFLIAYDASALNLTDVIMGQMLNDCGWEYFTYRHGPFGNCDGGCPSGMVRIVGLAELNDGGNHPDCFGPPDTDQYGLAVMRYLVSNDRRFQCQYAPIKFFWLDCGDNVLASVDGETSYIDNMIFDFEGNVIWNEEDEITYPEAERIANLGAPDICMNPEPNKPDPVRCVEFMFGGIDIICADSIDDRGDINLNGVANEVGDAVVFTNYFIYGMSAFTVNAEGQIAATDVNNDGITLSVSDLVYQIRVITGDAAPIPKAAPSFKANFQVMGKTINVDREIAAVALTLEGNVNAVLGHDAAHMEMISNYNGKNTRVLIYSFEKGAVCSGEIVETDGDVISMEAADYNGYKVEGMIVPAEFSATSYPNPFNPVTTIELNLPTSSDWNISIFNVTGQKIAEFEGYSEAGPMKVEWNGASHASGIYFYKATAGKYSATRKMVLLK